MLRKAAAAAIALITSIVIISQISAGAGAVAAVTSATINPGATGSVDVEARGIASPGLGAWEIGVTFDTSVVTAVSCEGQNGSVCNANFGPGRVQVVGASAGGLQGDSVLASITFRCGSAEDTAELSVVVEEFSDATTGAPQPMSPDINNGLITCEDSSGLPDVPTPVPTEPVSGLPSSGAGASGSSIVSWLIAALATLGLVTVTALGASRLFAQRADDGN